MAIYTPQAQRRRRLMILTVVAFLLGGLLGGIVGRFTAPTPADRVTAVREQARLTSSQLRVLSLHVEAGAASLGAGGDAGARLALRNADKDLTSALDLAPWIPQDRRNGLLTRLHNLERAASGAAATAPFAADVELLAKDIDTTFGLTPTAP